MKKNIIAIACTTVLCACTTDKIIYAPTSTKLDVRAAQQEVKGILTSRALMGSSEGRIILNDVRFRSDGMAFLIQQGQFTWALDRDWNYDSPGVRACYFSGMDSPRVRHQQVGLLGAFGTNAYYGVSMCGITAWFSSVSDAQRLADALYTLKSSASR